MSAMIQLDKVRKRPDNKGLSITRSLPYIEAANGKYTHRVRNVTLYEIIGKGHFAINCWCGQTLFYSDKHRSRFLPEPALRPICATCEGRVIGSGKTGERKINGTPVMFSPLVAP